MQSPHRGYRHLAAWLFATLMLASCASGPPVRDVDDSVLARRADYLRANPQGRFNEEILRSEVATGMDFDDMLASWGIPDTRIRAGGSDSERWVYVLADPYSHDWTRYDFVFVKRHLAQWEVMRNVASSHYLHRGDSAAEVNSIPPQPTTSFVPGGTVSPKR